MTTAKVWKQTNAFDGVPKLNDFILEEEILPDLQKNEILVEALYLSLDPYFRLLASPDQSLPGEQVARVLQSKSPEYPVGSLVCAHLGWRSHTVVNVKTPRVFGTTVDLINEVPGLSPSLWLGTVGMPGVTAYLSFFEHCDPKPGEVLVVTAASGAVGSIVGQLAKHKGLTVIGLAGSNEKCDYIKGLGFDHAINYKTEDISKALDLVAPSGVDIYFDNVGGEIADIVYGKLRDYGRVLICGLISDYNKSPKEFEKGEQYWAIVSLRICPASLENYDHPNPTVGPKILISVMKQNRNRHYKRQHFYSST
ncbi:prostaglandin reductase 1 [Biomphalaria pfeifferi]|uniref:15-oxoprostaglandin 13-reductase n=1 Tax=Biomphalaria pfeifferi TaxID=112525 RepID=A0AAD8AZ39_BIOPF|nr:prostaglandin reductase 1 [Biomphalaria pfeifferi]